MSDHGPAQLDLIRRYARTLREMHADAMRARPSAADREERVAKASPAEAKPPRIAGRPTTTTPPAS